MPWGRNVNPSKFNIEKPFLFSCGIKDHGGHRALTQHPPLNSKEERPRKGGLVWKGFTFSKPASQPGPLVLMPRYLGSGRSPEKWFSVWGTASLLPGPGVWPRWSSHKRGTTAPFVHPNLNANRPRGLRALRFSPAIKYRFIGFCAICLVLNVEPCPREGIRSRNTGAQVLKSTPALPPEGWATADTHLTVSAFPSPHQWHEETLLSHQCGHFQFFSAWVSQENGKWTTFPMTLLKCMPTSLFFALLSPPLVLQMKCIWTLGKRRHEGRGRDRTSPTLTQEEQDDLRSIILLCFPSPAASKAGS